MKKFNMRLRRSFCPDGFYVVTDDYYRVYQVKRRLLFLFILYCDDAPELPDCDTIVLVRVKIGAPFNCPDHLWLWRDKLWIAIEQSSFNIPYDIYIIYKHISDYFIDIVANLFIR